MVDAHFRADAAGAEHSGVWTTFQTFQMFPKNIKMLQVSKIYLKKTQIILFVRRFFFALSSSALIFC